MASPRTRGATFSIVQIDLVNFLIPLPIHWWEWSPLQDGLVLGSEAFGVLDVWPLIDLNIPRLTGFAIPSFPPWVSVGVSLSAQPLLIVSLWFFVSIVSWLLALPPARGSPHCNTLGSLLTRKFGQQTIQVGSKMWKDIYIDTTFHKICKLRAAKPQKISQLPLSPLLCVDLIGPLQVYCRKPKGVKKIPGQVDLGLNPSSGPYYLFWQILSPIWAQCSHQLMVRFECSALIITLLGDS